MGKYPRLVHWSYSDGTGLFTTKNTKEHLRKVYITDKKGEGVLKRGEIAALTYNSLLGPAKDPYFRVENKEGFTRRAKKHGDMGRKIKEEYPDLEWKLDGISSKVRDYDDYVYVDIPHIDNYVNPLTNDKRRFENTFFVNKEYFDLDFMLELIEYEPLNLMGSTISAYHKEELPEFFLSLKTEFPDLYKETLEASEWLREKMGGVSYKGRNAYLMSLKPGPVKVEVTILVREVFEWDGETLRNEKEIEPGETMEQIITPKEDFLVEIVDEVVVSDTIRLE